MFSHNQKDNRWAQYDTGAAAENLCLQATSMGLAVHQMGGYDRDKTREIFGIPAEYDLMAMMAVGYMADVDGLPEDLKDRELQERRRKPVDELYFQNTWEK